MLIGITGTDGAGKGLVVEYLIESHNFTHYSSRELIMEEIARLGLEPVRANLAVVGNKMRTEQGEDVIVKTALEKAKQAGVERVIIESIRAEQEAVTLQKAGGILLAVDAPVLVRYERIVGRGTATDKVSLEEFKQQEELEMNDQRPGGMQKAKVMQMADYTISNDSTIAKLREKIEELLREVGGSK